MMLEIFLASLSGAAFFMFIYMTLWYIVATTAKRIDLIEVAVGLGLVLTAMLILVSFENASFRPIIVSLLAFIWGLRLSLFMFLRNSARSENPRYQALREKWGKCFFLRGYFEIFLMRGAVILVIALPVIYVNTFGGGELGFLDFIGLAIWLAGFGFEFIGDYQLSKFLNNPANAGKTMKSGLWAIVAHPNYVGEMAMWWGIFLMALAIPYGYLMVISPLMVMFLFFRRVAKRHHSE